MLCAKYNIKYIRQTVLSIDYNEFLKSKTSWKIIERYDGIDSFLIECDIKDFIDNFAEGCGIK